VPLGIGIEWDDILEDRGVIKNITSNLYKLNNLSDGVMTEDLMLYPENRIADVNDSEDE
jgi:hypothetical protein